MVVDVGFLDVVMDVFGVTPFGSDDIFVKVLSERFCFTDATVSRCHCLALGVGLVEIFADEFLVVVVTCLLYTSPSPRDKPRSRMPSSA